MKRFQWDALRGQYPRLCQRRSARDPAPVTPPKLYYAFRGKGQILDVVYFRSNDAVVRFDDGAEKWIHYTRLECLDADGQPYVAEVTDTTGRIIEVGNWIAYSMGRLTLEVGRVDRITPTGGLMVKACLHNGRKVTRTKWNSNEIKLTSVSNPDGAIKLPVEASTMMMWLLSDFENMQDWGSND